MTVIESVWFSVNTPLEMMWKTDYKGTRLKGAR
jgi:hypothetical protein